MHIAATWTCTCHLPCSISQDKLSCASALIHKNLFSACIRSRTDCLQTEQRRRAEAARKAAEAAAEAKQEADIAAYHARLRNKEADGQQQINIGRDDQPAGAALAILISSVVAAQHTAAYQIDNNTHAHAHRRIPTTVCASLRYPSMTNSC